jgi:uroporphyrin-III C-methyltransferase/precorrin-2 dehydrogenase/sirohydrochlorin ferrochelatase
MNYLPINIKLNNNPVLVLGGGNVAQRKISSLLLVDANIICVALAFNSEVLKLAENKQIKIQEMDLSDIEVLDQFDKVSLIISATDDANISQAAYAYAQQRQILINTVDQQPLCDFITPAIVDRSPVVVAISSEGSAPVLARIIKQKIEYLLPANLGYLATIARKLRGQIKQSVPEFNNRRRFWERFFQWSHRSQAVLKNTFQATNPKQVNAIITAVNQTQGKVSLVGAGPGNPDLLTLKAIKVLQTADVVMHDHLISKEIIYMIRKDAELIDVGKQAGNHKTKQQHINQLLIEHAKQGLHVCRLKGGDSFVFGRGGEEVLALAEHKIPFEIVPGITAAVGCAAYAGIPLTHRDHAQSLAFITAHCSDSIDTIDWQFYAKNHQTLAVYMGLIKADDLTNLLIENGKSPDEHIAVIENGSRETQRTLTGHLHQLPDMIRKHQVQSPALIVIGAVTKYAEKLDWFVPHIPHIETTKYLKSA